MKIGYINITDKVILFDGHYTTHKGPLPRMVYMLSGLWVLENRLLMAVWKADKLPVQDGELILHRYEGDRAVHPADASYRYFTVPGYAGMVLSTQACGRMSNPNVQKSFMTLSTQANLREGNQWLSSLSPEEQQDLSLLSIPDQLGNFGSVILFIKGEHS